MQDKWSSVFWALDRTRDHTWHHTCRSFPGALLCGGGGSVFASAAHRHGFPGPMSSKRRLHPPQGQLAAKGLNQPLELAPVFCTILSGCCCGFCIGRPHVIALVSSISSPPGGQVQTWTLMWFLALVLQDGMLKAGGPTSTFRLPPQVTTAPSGCHLVPSWVRHCRWRRANEAFSLARWSTQNTRARRWRVI